MSKAHLPAVLAEMKVRANDAIALFRALVTQVGFIVSMATWRLMRGGNRSGKSTICAVEVASAALGRPVCGPDGEPLPFKYPTNRPLMIWVIGLGESHVGDTLYRLLFEPGAFKLIKDAETGKLRAFNPSDPADKAREAEAVPAPPLIPPRFAGEETFAWKDKKARVFTRWTHPNTGTVIRAFTSLGDVKQGDPVDLIWVDEDIADPKDIDEYSARLSDRKGRGIWSSWPRIANPALLAMSTRAQEQAARPNPDCAEWCLVFTENPFIDADEKRKRLEEWGPEVSRARDRGEFVLDTVLMYPEFRDLMHCVPKADGLLWDDVDRELAKNNWMPPLGWTLRLFLDPGHGTTAVWFLATTPPELGDYVIGFDELYLHQCTPTQAANLIREKTVGRRYYKFIIDYRGSRSHQQTSAVPTDSIRDHWAAAFKAANLVSVATGSSFQFSSDDVPAGLTASRQWLIPRANGKPRLRVIRHKCQNWIKEIQLFRKHVTKDISEDRPATGQADHLMDDFRYAAMEGCAFVAYPDDGLGGIDPGPAYRAFQEFNKLGGPPKSQQQSAHFGPGTAA